MPTYKETDWHKKSSVYNLNPLWILNLGLYYKKDTHLLAWALHSEQKKRAWTRTASRLSLVPQSDTEVWEHEQKPLKTLHFYGMDARVSQ